MALERSSEAYLAHPLRWSSLAGYALTCLLPVAGCLAGRGFEETFGAGSGGPLAWPYPLLLPLKPLLATFGALEILVADALGLAGVYGLARLLEHRMGPAARHPLGATVIGAVSWPFFLAVVNGLIYMTGIGALSQVAD